MRNATATRERGLRYLEQRITPAAVTMRIPLAVSQWTAPGEPVPFATASLENYTPSEAGCPWGSPWSTTWLRVTGTIPPAKRGIRREITVDLGFTDAQVGFQAEGLAYTRDGAVVKALNPRSRWLPAAPLTLAGESVDFFVEAAANPSVLTHGTSLFEFQPTALGDRMTAGSATLYRLGDVRAQLIDEEVEALAMDLRVLLELEQELPESSGRRWNILTAIDNALDALRLDDIAAAATTARSRLTRVLSSPATASAHTISAIGHAHIDSAWLWPFRETRRKVARTVANVLLLMDEHPELRYAMSSAQQYQWLKEDHPELFERVKARVAEGRFIPVGGMWVEADTNMPSGEAMVRQFLEGSRLFADEFGIDQTDIAWLPDSFGYSAALPQIVRGTGCRRFITQKISWNAINRFPHHTFWWEGIDGSRVFTHFPSGDTYNSGILASELAHADRNFADKGSTDRSLLPFGYGDGGGGPTREMLQRIERIANLEGSPRVNIESPREFFDATETELADPAVWMGELYLEFHRGVFTSQARTKAGNRRCEALFREAELWCTTATLRLGAEYPHDVLRRLWRRFLLLQFHDVLPGSSIAWVHNEAEREFAGIAEQLRELISQALSSLSDTAPETPALVNPTPYSVAGVPAHSVGTPTHRGPATALQYSNDEVLLSNGVIEATVDSVGGVSSVRICAGGRETAAPAQRLGQLQLFDDTPNRWDAWDLDEDYRRATREWDTIRPLGYGVDGDVAWVRAEYRTKLSTATQTILLRAGARQLEFETEVDWHESETLLKVAFPLDIATERWAAETQFGHVWRPTTANTSWEAAKYEACAHRWVYVGEPGHGVAIANSNSYGHEVQRLGKEDGNVTTLVRISLLRSPRFPDPESDRGAHVFRYSVVPSATVSLATHAGHLLGDDVRMLPIMPTSPAVTSSNADVVIDTLKIADDQSGDVIVRMYESTGGHSQTTLGWSFATRSVVETDLLERPLRDLDGQDSVRLSLRPFQVMTVRLARP